MLANTPKAIEDIQNADKPSSNQPSNLQSTSSRPANNALQAPLPAAELSDEFGDYSRIEDDALNSYSKYITSAAQLSDFTKISEISTPDDAAHTIEFYTHNSDKSHWVLKRYKNTDSPIETEKNVLFAITEAIAANLHNILAPNSAPEIRIVSDNKQNYPFDQAYMKQETSHQTITIDGVASKRFIPFISLETFLSSDAHKKITTQQNSKIIFGNQSSKNPDSNTIILPSKYEGIFKATLETKIKWLIEQTDDTFINAYAASMILQEDDLHKGNIGLSYDPEAQKLIVVRIDFDMCFRTFLESYDRSRSKLDPATSFRNSASYFAGQSSKTNWLSFPNEEAHYNPIEYRFGAIKEHAYTQDEAKLFSTHLNNPSIDKKRFRIFLKYLLLPKKLLDLIFDNQAELKLSFLNQRKKVKLDFFKMPGALQWFQELSLKEINSIISETINHSSLNKDNTTDANSDFNLAPSEMRINYYKILRSHNLNHLSDALFSLQKLLIYPTTNIEEKTLIQNSIKDIRNKTTDFFAVESSKLTLEDVATYSEAMQANITKLKNYFDKKSTDDFLQPLTHLQNYIAHFTETEREPLTKSTTSSKSTDNIFQYQVVNSKFIFQDKYESFCIKQFYSLLIANVTYLSDAITQLQTQVIALDETEGQRKEALQQIIRKLSEHTIAFRQINTAKLALEDIENYTQEIYLITEELEEKHQQISSEIRSSISLLKKYISDETKLGDKPQNDLSWEKISITDEELEAVFIPPWEDFYKDKLYLAIGYLADGLRELRYAVCSDQDKEQLTENLRKAILETYDKIKSINITDIYTLLPNFITQVKDIIAQAEAKTKPLSGAKAPIFAATISLKEFINDVTNQKQYSDTTKPSFLLSTTQNKKSNNGQKTQIPSTDKKSICELLSAWIYKEQKSNSEFLGECFKEAHDLYKKQLEQNDSYIQRARSILFWQPVEYAIPITTFTHAVDQTKNIESMNDMKQALHKLLKENLTAIQQKIPGKLKNAFLNTLLSKFFKSLSKNNIMLLFIDCVKNKNLFPTSLLLPSEVFLHDAEMQNLIHEELTTTSADKLITPQMAYAA